MDRRGIGEAAKAKHFAGGGEQGIRRDDVMCGASSWSSESQVEVQIINDNSTSGANRLILTVQLDSTYLLYCTVGERPRET